MQPLPDSSCKGDRSGAGGGGGGGGGRRYLHIH